MTITRKERKIRHASDAVAVAHLVMANFILVIGIFMPELFMFATYNVPTKYSGLDFLYKYVDLPVCMYFDCSNGPHVDVGYTYMTAEVVIILSSILYWIASYVILKIMFIFFE